MLLIPFCFKNFFISFSCLIALARTSIILLNKSDENEYPYLISDHKGKAFSFSLNVILAGGLSHMAFVIVRLFLMAQLTNYLPPRRRYRFNPCVRKILWKRKWQPTPVFLPRKSHGYKSLAGNSPWDCKWVGCDLATKQQHFSYTQYVGTLYYRWILNSVTCFCASIWIIIWFFLSSFCSCGVSYLLICIYRIIVA